MWEYRVVWSRGKPPQWDAAWKLGLRVLAVQGREPEPRPDDYLVMDRADAGLKLRGGKADDFDLKVLHRRSGGWELWEKCRFEKWNALEVVRLAAMLGLSSEFAAPKDSVTPAQGVEAVLEAAGLRHTKVTVEKTRIQAAARDVLSAWDGSCVDPGWLLELVEITLPQRTARLYSLCLESVEPLAGGVEPVAPAGGLCAGYPELLLRHLQKSL